MKRFEDGSILLENDDDKKKYCEGYFNLKNFIQVVTEHPEAWEDFKYSYPEEVEKLRKHLGLEE